MAVSQDYKVNYDDKRFTQVEADKNAALNKLNQTYDGMINQADSYYEAQIDATKDWAEKQEQIQQEKTDFAIEQVEHQKELAKKDYLKEQSGAYVDWQKQSNEYGANAEAMAAQGMMGTGYRESSQVNMYVAYQNRVATARESYNRAVTNYDMAIKDAQLQNNAALAEIAYNALKTQLELSLEGFQYKNQLIMNKADKIRDVEDTYYTRYQDVLKQINTENALAEEVRQYNESLALDKQKLAEEQRQYNESLALQKAQLEEEKRQYNETMAYNKSKSSGSGGGGSSGGSGGKVKSGGSGKKSYSEGKDTSAHFSTQKDRETNAKQTVTNRHTDSWVEVGGAGRFSWTEVLAHVKDGSIKEVKSGNKITYKWVGKKSSGNGKNVTPDKKGYAAKQYNLFYGSGAR